MRLTPPSSLKVVRSTHFSPATTIPAIVRSAWRLTEKKVLFCWRAKRLRFLSRDRIAPSCDPHTGENYWGNNHLAQIREFYRCIRENRQPPVTPEDATATLEVVLALYRSAKAGTRQDLPLPE